MIQRTSLLSILFILGIVLISFGQHGYLGKKTYLSAQAGFNTPILSGTFHEDNFVSKGSEMKNRKDLLDYGASVDLMRNINNRLSIGITGVYKQFTVRQDPFLVRSFTDLQGHSFLDTTWLRLQRPNFESFSILPKLEFFQKAGNGPVGIYHEFGIGVGVTKLSGEAYDVSLNKTNPTEETSWSPTDRYRLETVNKSYRSMLFLYGVGLRMPLNDFLSFTVSVRYTATIYSRPSDAQILEKPAEIFDESELFFRVQRANLSVIQFNGGLTFHF